MPYNIVFQKYQLLAMITHSKHVQYALYTCIVSFLCACNISICKNVVYGFFTIKYHVEKYRDKYICEFRVFAAYGMVSNKLKF